ncbi:unnamed protein product [Penicillium salamii]|nr:unnamed protein product [Penicillium salamii]CAG8367239.1 unnamed protein product [Penicillium salamii]
MADNSPDYKALFLEAEKQRAEAEEQRKQAEDEARREKERREKAEERDQPTTFVELLRHSHDLLSRPLRVEIPSRATTGTIPLPTGKYCPTRLEFWTDCSTQQLELYKSKAVGQQLLYRPMSSEQDLEFYERSAVEYHVHRIITELCKLPAARDEFGLGDGIQFNNHTNILHENEAIEADPSQESSVHHPKPDQFCINRVDDKTTTVLTSVEYKPPHKLSVAALRLGLRPMDLWKDMVKSNKIPTDQEAKLKYNAEQLVCSALAQEYHVMIQEGLEYSYVTNGIARVLLRVPHDDPSTLYYFLCDPNNEMNAGVEDDFQQLNTSVARTLCLCLMAFRSVARGQEWRNSARAEIPVWKTSFDHTRSKIPEAERQKTLHHSDSTPQEYTSPDSGSAYNPSSPSPDPSQSAARRRSSRSTANCAPPSVHRRSQSPDSSGSDSNQATNRKRGFSQVTSLPSAQRAVRQRRSGNNQGTQAQDRDAQFCTQRCLLGLQSGGVLDDCCPNVMRHRRNNDDLHPITSENLVGLLKGQLDENIDRCIPLGGPGGYGAPFKLTCAVYGYTVVGKGTTSGLWKEVSREAQVYQILR